MTRLSETQAMLLDCMRAERGDWRTMPALRRLHMAELGRWDNVMLVFTAKELVMAGLAERRIWRGRWEQYRAPEARLPVGELEIAAGRQVRDPAYLLMDAIAAGDRDVRILRDGRHIATLVVHPDRDSHV
jgi:hypothetical protein